MFMLQLGQSIRQMRRSQGMSQADLALRADVSRPTICLLENGLVPDLGVKKVAAIAGVLGLRLGLGAQSQSRRTGPDFVRIACSAANVSLREQLGADELVAAIISGHVPPNKRANFRVLFDDLPAQAMAGLKAQIADVVGVGRVERGMAKLQAMLQTAAPT